MKTNERAKLDLDYHQETLDEKITKKLNG